MASLDVTVSRSIDPAKFLRSDETVWFGERGSQSVETQLSGVPEDQRFVADIDGDASPVDTHAGVYGVRPMRLSVPAGPDGAGRLVPMAGLTWVGVHPDVRRRGVLTAMLRHHVEQTHAEGVAVSGLHASEPGIYGRHGYGLATREVALTLSRGTTLTAPAYDDAAAAVRTALGPTDDPALADRIMAIDERVAPGEVGMVVAGREYYARIANPGPEDMRGEEPLRVIYAHVGGEEVGCVAFRRTHKWEDDLPGGELKVLALVGAPVVRLALLRRVLDMDLIGKVTLPGVGLDDPLLLWLAPRSSGKAMLRDNIWLRLIDLEAAVPQRWYAGDCDVVVELEDPAAPWQAGRWRIVASGGEGAAARTDDEAAVTLPVSALSAAYLGGADLAAWSRAGLLSEHRPGALAELGRAWRTEVQPTPAMGF